MLLYAHGERLWYGALKPLFEAVPGCEQRPLIIMMSLTIEQYHKFNAAQRKKVKRDERQSLLDEHLNTEGKVNPLRGIIRDEMNTNHTQLKTDLNKSIDIKIRNLF